MRIFTPSKPVLAPWKWPLIVSLMLATLLAAAFYTEGKVTLARALQVVGPASDGRWIVTAAGSTGLGVRAIQVEARPASGTVPADYGSRLGARGWREFFYGDDTAGYVRDNLLLVLRDDGITITRWARPIMLDLAFTFYVLGILPALIAIGASPSQSSDRQKHSGSSASILAPWKLPLIVSLTLLTLLAVALYTEGRITLARALQVVGPASDVPWVVTAGGSTGRGVRAIQVEARPANGTVPAGYGSRLEAQGWRPFWGGDETSGYVRENLLLVLRDDRITITRGARSTMLDLALTFYVLGIFPALIAIGVRLPRAHLLIWPGLVWSGLVGWPMGLRCIGNRPYGWTKYGDPVFFRLSEELTRQGELGVWLGFALVIMAIVAVRFSPGKVDRPFRWWWPATAALLSLGGIWYCWVAAVFACGPWSRSG